MWRLLSNASLAQRLFMAATLTALLSGIVIALLGISYVQALSTINAAVAGSNNAIKHITDMQEYLLRMNALLGALEAEGVNNGKNIREIQHLTQRFDTLLERYRQNDQIATSPGMRSVLETLHDSNQGQEFLASQHTNLMVISLQWNKYKAAQNQVIASLSSHIREDQLNEKIDQSNAEYLPLMGNLDNLANQTQNMYQMVADVNELKIRPIIFWTLCAMFFSGLAIFLITYLINQTITHPLSHLVDLTQRIANGETEARAEVNGPPEIQQVARSMNIMLDGSSELLKKIEGQRDALELRVQELITEVQGLAQGDLRIEVEVTDDEMGSLATSFNFMIQALSNLIIRVKQVVYDVEQLNRTTRSYIRQLVALDDSQMQYSVHAVKVVEQMTVSTHEVADRAKDLSKIAHKTQATAHAGRKALEQASDGTLRIQDTVRATAGKCQVLDESSRQIDSMVQVIANIAHQTNRMALDASIQAALAGEHGKGFAAVATDIRRLSEETKGQLNLLSALGHTITENIGTVANAMSDTERETARGTELAMQAGRALSSIFDIVDHQTQAIEDINGAAVNQLEFSQEVLQIMQNVANNTREGGEKLREAQGNMERLTRLLERLQASVGAFKLRNEQQASVSSHTPEISRHHSLHAIQLYGTDFNSEQEQDSDLTDEKHFSTNQGLST